MGPLRVLQAEYALAVRLVGRHNFIEGVRAVVVDKDRQPAWRPASLAEVQDADIDALFAPLPPGAGLRL
jgi:enoyl-CoA hydratase